MAKTTVIMDTGSAINRDMYYMSCSFADRSFDEPFSRLFFYQDKNKDKWFYHDQPEWRVVSTCFPPPLQGEARKVYALSEEGEIECFSREKISIEVIKDAGLRPDSRMYGYVNKMRYIDDALYVCGDRGQIYKKTFETWSHFDDGILQASPLISDSPDLSLSKKIKKAIDSIINLFDINGSKDGIYTVGSNGFIAYHNGTIWKKLTQLTAADLHSIYMTSSGTIWIVGEQGTVITGDIKFGFTLITDKIMDVDFYSVTQFQDRIYIAASDGIYTIEKNRSLNKLDFPTGEISNIESKDGVMWALSSDKLLRFDGYKWDEFEHIDN